MRLSGKIALITGAGGGIGRAAATLFAREEASVVINDWNAESGEETVRRIREAGGEALFVGADVSEPEQVQAMIRQTIEAHGRLDVLYNNAAVGYSTPMTNGSVLDISPEDWDRVVAINLRSVYLGCKYAIPVMVRQGGGAIINTASIMAIRAMPGADGYTAAKGGIISLSRTLARQFGPEGVRVNVLCPGTTATPMIGYPLEMSEDVPVETSYIPLGRLGRPGDVAYAALYLASDEAAFVTGAVLVVDGGQTI